MDPDLNPVVAALAELSDAELRALITATYGVPQTAPGLLAWLDSTCECAALPSAGVFIFGCP
jgi:hypothetical protein